MIYDSDYIEFAMGGIRLLPLIAAVAIASYAAKNRVMFFAGTLGCFLGVIVPQPIREGNWGGSMEYAYMASVTVTPDHLLAWGIPGAMILCVLAL
ncbi:MAG: hypothetical protein IH991_10340, partial [Planctomycetes bacterium]|nr:hypothetical protein [Planctomycetota bacterium]